jgi:hypothetical protein
MNENDAGQHDPMLDELRNLFAQDDPVPPLVTQTAKAALGWRRLDADLAELLSDSSLDAESLTLARGAGAALRSVSFSAGPLTIDVEIRGEGPDRTMLGQVSPPARARIEVQTADGSAATATDSDDLGRFRTRLPVASSIRLRVAIGDRDRPNWIETSWIPL